MSQEGPATVSQGEQLPALPQLSSLRGLPKGKAGIVTGAGRGIGMATAVLFARAGAKVVLASRDEDRPSWSRIALVRPTRSLSYELMS
ncbi:MAG: SDR family NAD(P)-dependent oxidoreductase [Nitrososphaerota archaeon]|nr:SDR family NAD(P)-dependent oxidoreductase [Nitrososphaerota archaeon]MDG6969377.1 SDR family NAD(P)-dependent oxidoreductase [Nitrososphaerota archaeon]MDG6972982.1 SDR family NAD(P)-dependent oxidoreductase [Nitrososphaerota archaeon]MDG7015250.1 SDR family NAD(P)-dependent oxidoreductase [Nitrososphaerota archaeon]WGO50006.1 MAG: SDR family NAD(P)-dependent oxidoreductase [Nitrososphaerota archaeon]